MSNLQNEVRTVLKQAITIENVKVNIENDQIPKKNKALSLDCSIMFVDMRGSTVLTDDNSKKNMVRIYKALARVVTYAAKEHNGEVKQIVGDGYLCLFVSDNEGESAKKALDCATLINIYIGDILNPEISSFSKSIAVGYGICTGNVLLAKVGRKGKGKVAVPVFASSVTNYASKYCGIAAEKEIIIDEATCLQLPHHYKANFKKCKLTINDEDHTVYRVGESVWKKN